MSVIKNKMKMKITENYLVLTLILEISSITQTKQTQKSFLECYNYIYIYLY